MSEIKHFDFWEEDWLGGTIGLSYTQKGVYIDAICAMVREAGEVTAAQIHRWGRQRGIAVRALRELVAIGKLKLTEAGRYINHRAMKEIATARAKIEAALRLNRKPTQNLNQDLNQSGGSKPPINNNSEAPFLANSQDSLSAPRIEREGARAQGAVLVDQPTRKEEAGHAQRRTQISLDWQPDDECCTYARGRGHDDAWIEDQRRRFVCYHGERGNYRADWRLAWITWVDRDAEFGGSRSRVSAHSTGTVTPMARSRPSVVEAGQRALTRIQMAKAAQRAA